VTRARPPAQDFGSRAERFAAGKMLRRRLPRSSHAIWAPASDRPDPVELLQRYDRLRRADLLPIRYGRMSLSPFAFLRGSAVVMANDFATTPVTGPRVQLCGDAHMNNFGVFATPERDLVFDLDDFDETLPGPWEWDVKRLATSLVLAGRQNRFSRDLLCETTRATVRAYRRSLAIYARMRYLTIWYSHLDRKSLPMDLRRRARKQIGRMLDRAVGRTEFNAVPRVAKPVRGEYRIREEPPLIVHYKDRADAEGAVRLYENYLATLPASGRMLLEHYRWVDVAQKVVGVGSVGTNCSVLLLMGDRDILDPLFLQVKQALPSVLEPYAGASVHSSHGQRVVAGQHLIQEASDELLGWSTLGSNDYYVRQLRDMRVSFAVATAGRKAMIGKGEACGAALARAHARTGDPALISGYLGEGTGFDEAITAFAEAYADQTEQDYAEFVRAIKSGRLGAEVGV